MAYYVRPMRREDIRQVAEIDREAFPTMLPPTNLHNELQNRLAHYLVAVDTERTLEIPGNGARPEGGLARIANRVFRFFNHDRLPDVEAPLPGEYIVGFVGMWILVDEAHITTIAVREVCRGRGIGELLLISIVDLAVQLQTRMVTLEVRVSNLIAQKLYLKYSFTKAGLRRGYYTDNFEDGLLMSTGDIQAPEFGEQFHRLKEIHFRKLVTPYYPVAR